MARQPAKTGRRSPSKLPSSGNRRNPHTHEAILASTLKLLETERYQTLTIEAIAAHAGVGKATVYRWWPSKSALVAEAVTSTLIVEEPPETEDLRADLIAAAEITIRNYARGPGGVLVIALAADLASDPDLLRSFTDHFMLPRRNAVRPRIQHAIDVGLISAHLDPDLIMDMWAGSVLYRMLMKHLPVDDGFATRLVDAFFVEASTTE